MKRIVALLAIASLSSPAYAGVREAAYSSSADRAQQQTSVFTGVTYTIGFDRRSDSPRGRASLKFAGMAHAPTTSQMRIGQGLELTAARNGNPALSFAGQDVGRLRKQANLSGGTTALIIGGVVVLAVIAAVVVSDAIKDDKCGGDC